MNTGNGFNSNDFNNSFGNYSRNVEQDWRPKKNYEGVALACLICGCAGFIFNPFYLVSLAAIILGIIALCNKTTAKTLAIIGLCLAPVAAGLQLVFDIFTFGLGVFF